MGHSKLESPCSKQSSKTLSRPLGDSPPALAGVDPALVLFIYCDPPMMNFPNTWDQRTFWIQRAYYGPAILRAALWKILFWERWIRGNPEPALKVTLCWWKQAREAVGWRREGEEGREVLVCGLHIHTVSWVGSEGPYRILESHTPIQVVIHPCISSTSTVGWHSKNICWMNKWT